MLAFSARTMVDVRCSVAVRVEMVMIGTWKQLGWAMVRVRTMELAWVCYI